eukprot:626460-Amphidinium_carterae.1
MTLIITVNADDDYVLGLRARSRAIDEVTGLQGVMTQFRKCRILSGLVLSNVCPTNWSISLRLAQMCYCMHPPAKKLQIECITNFNLRRLGVTKRNKRSSPSNKAQKAKHTF